VVGIEHDHDFAGGVRQAVIEVARLGVDVSGPGQVLAVEGLAELRELPAAGARRLGGLDVVGLAFLVGAAVVEQPHRELVLRIGHGAGGRQGRGEEVRLLVVGRHVDIDGG
jgi:hypothetical protein